MRGLKLEAQQQTKIQILYELCPILCEKQDRGKKREDFVYIHKHAGEEELTTKIPPSGHTPTDFSGLIPASKRLWSYSLSCEEAQSWSGP